MADFNMLAEQEAAADLYAEEAAAEEEPEPAPEAPEETCSCSRLYGIYFCKMIPQLKNQFGKIPTWSLILYFLNYAYFDI